MADFADEYTVRVRGQAELDRLNAELQRNAVAANAAGVSNEQFAAANRQAIQRVQELEQAMSRAGGGQKMLNAGLIEGSRALDDIQYGFQGVLNNVQQFAFMAGLSGPVIAGITVATVALGQVVKRWGDITKAFSDAGNFSAVKTEVEELQNRLKKLGEERVELKVSAKEVERAEEILDDLRRAINAYESMSATASDKEAAQKEAVAEALSRGGYTGKENEGRFLAEYLRATPRTKEEERIGDELVRLEAITPSLISKLRDKINAMESGWLRGGVIAERSIKKWNAEIQEHANRLLLARDDYQTKVEGRAKKEIGEAMEGDAEAIQRLKDATEKGDFSKEFEDLIKGADWESIVARRKGDRDREEKDDRAETDRRRRAEDFLKRIREGEETTPEERQAYLNPKLPDLTLEDFRYDEPKLDEAIRERRQAALDRAQALADAEKDFAEKTKREAAREKKRAADELAREKETIRKQIEGMGRRDLLDRVKDGETVSEAERQTFINEDPLRVELRKLELQQADAANAERLKKIAEADSERAEREAERMANDNDRERQRRVDAIAKSLESAWGDRSRETLAGVGSSSIPALLDRLAAVAQSMGNTRGESESASIQALADVIMQLEQAIQQQADATGFYNRTAVDAVNRMKQTLVSSTWSTRKVSETLRLSGSLLPTY